jgi:hypothetical protein
MLAHRRAMARDLHLSMAEGADMSKHHLTIAGFRRFVRTASEVIVEVKVLIAEIAFLVAFIHLLLK